MKNSNLTKGVVGHDDRQLHTNRWHSCAVSYRSSPEHQRSLAKISETQNMDFHLMQAAALPSDPCNDPRFLGLGRKRKILRSESTIESLQALTQDILYQSNEN